MIKDYRVQVNAGETIARGSSPRVAVGRALEEQYANPGKFKFSGADCNLDYQLKVGETLVIKCTRVK
ncbi:hypothetical protein LCGC14_0541450 [marine sediment metagenome]|uniref:Uncharacterized protein n=1 Tax=marine sediment metagenome TaxID=412755 RepID=A0A0F9UE63_9ZZZZ